MAKKKFRIRKGDNARVVLTETAPYEVPIMFSNHGFYKHCKARSEENNYYFKKLFTLIVENGRAHTPLAYKVRKDEISLRTLSLLHPASQWLMKDFYTKYNSLICYYCSKSPASIRYPATIGGTFYYKNENENINKYRSPRIGLTSTDVLMKHPASYFCYEGYDRLYKFFDSQEFIELEKKYTNLWIIDVSKCFDSIYTHTLSWAVKSKQFIKSNMELHTFGEAFDILMRNSKDRETNGIVIGPEISRIFAEIILQEVDECAIKEMAKLGKQFNREYSFKRYVDDYFIFAASSDIAHEVAQVLSLKLFEYNLHINVEKRQELTRPFYTKKSIVIHNADKMISEFVGKFNQTIFSGGNNVEPAANENVTSETEELENSEDDDDTEEQDGGETQRVSASPDEETLERAEQDNSELIPTKIHNYTKLKNSFIHSIKSSSASNNCDYTTSSNYIISSLSRRISRLVESGAKYLHKDPDSGIQYKSSISCLLETMFFFYTVEPSVAASYNLSKAIVLAARFFENELPEYEPQVKQKILELFIAFYESNEISEVRKRIGVTPLEVLNILLALGDLGSDYLLPLRVLEDIFKINNDTCYLELMSCLYYIGDIPEYQSLRDAIQTVIGIRLSNLSTTIAKAETAYLLLDSLTCPYLTDPFKGQIIANINAQLNVNLLEGRTLPSMLTRLRDNPWFINWQNIDLLSLLARKELSAAY